MYLIYIIINTNVLAFSVANVQVAQCDKRLLATRDFGGV